MCRLLSMFIQILFLSPLFTPTEGCLDFVCSNTSYENSNNTFASNLELLFSSLSSSNVSFYNETIGKEPNAVYGFALCRRYISSDECQHCLQNATEEIKKLCPTKKSATLCLPKCHLHYSHRRIFSILDDSEKRVVGGDWNLKHVKNPIEFHRSLIKLLSNLSYEAAFSPSNDMLAYRMAEFNESNKVYALVQCTQYLSRNDCYSCLQDSMRYVGNGSLSREGEWIDGKSCNLSYWLLLQSPTPPPSSSEARKQISFSTNSCSIITIGVICTVGLNAAVVIYIVGNHFRRMEERKMSKDADADADARITIPSFLVSLKFDLDTIRAATENFASSNKLGQGGFGPVYKGLLSDGQEIAVKRLSVNSAQGEEEFQNEVALAAQLQHRNLVRILGCCTEGGEKLLVYEYVPNKSLNSFIDDPNLKFCLEGCTDKAKCTYLDWAQRYKIIQGIARGLLYLHEGSRIRIIHRDLKTSNVLLDKEMTPKISDFGMARIFKVDQSQASTNRIVGTYGYMSPEYIMHGQYSEKSDVFSFGVVLLEIVCGKKNSSFYQSDNAEDLLSYVWRHWKEGRASEMVDSTLNHFPMDVVKKCIHIGLLCVQEDAAARPTMSSVIIMLNSDSISIPLASPPAFYFGSRSWSEMFSRLHNAQSTADMTITIPR